MHRLRATFFLCVSFLHTRECEDVREIDTEKRVRKRCVKHISQDISGVWIVWIERLSNAANTIQKTAADGVDRQTI